MAASIIEIQNLSFQYTGAEKPVFANFSLNIEQGGRFGLLGPNGAGKTTLMNLMTGVLLSPSGKIFLNGKNIAKENQEVKKLFGFVPQHHSFYPELTAAENMQFFGAWAGLNKKQIAENANALLGILGLSAASHKPVSKFSGGMKSRLNLAIGVIHQPKILFLDEPTSGVDVQTRHAIVEYLKQLNANGTTLVYTSHLLSEAELLCTELALLDEGKIIMRDKTESLLVGGTLEDLFLKHTGKNYRDADV